MQSLADHVNYPFHAIANFVGPLSPQALLYSPKHSTPALQKFDFYWAQLTKAK